MNTAAARNETHGTAQPRTMKAIIADRYGPPEVLRLGDLPLPVIDDDRVLIRVRAAALNPMDYHTLRGHPIVRLVNRSPRKPKRPVLGADVAGEVVAVGKNVSEFRPGDEVFGGCAGALAEYARARATSLAKKPANVSFEQAAAVPVAGFTALQGLRDKGRLRPGQRVLINGAAGGVGTFAVQIAKAFGAHVTGVCSARNVDLVRSIGADRVVDYTHEDFARGGEPYDLILDNVGNRSLSDLRRALGPDGILVLNSGAGSLGRLLVRLSTALVLSRFGSQKMLPFLANQNKEDLIVLKELVEAGKVTPVVDRTYPLGQTADALRYLKGQHARGKVIITL